MNPNLTCLTLADYRPKFRYFVTISITSVSVCSTQCLPGSWSDQSPLAAAVTADSPPALSHATALVNQPVHITAAGYGAPRWPTVSDSPSVPSSHVPTVGGTVRQTKQRSDIVIQWSGDFS